MIQKLLIGVMALVLSVITPMVVLDHQRVASQLQTLTDSSYLSYLEITKLKTSQDYTQVRLATRLLYVPDLGNGSGVMIAPRRMLTAAHVAQINEQVPLLLNGKPIKVLKIDKDLDLALLEVDEDCPCVSVTKEMPKPDTKAVIVGFPMHQETVPQYLTEGRIQGFSEKLNRLFAAINAAPGTSGGGLFVRVNDTWELAGILVSVAGIGSIFSLIPITYMSMSVDTDSINKFLKE